MKSRKFSGLLFVVGILANASLALAMEDKKGEQHHTALGEGTPLSPPSDSSFKTVRSDGSVSSSSASDGEGYSETTPMSWADTGTSSAKQKRNGNFSHASENSPLSPSSGSGYGSFENSSRTFRPITQSLTTEFKDSGNSKNSSPPSHTDSDKPKSGKIRDFLDRVSHFARETAANELKSIETDESELESDEKRKIRILKESISNLKETGRALFSAAQVLDAEARGVDFAEGAVSREEVDSTESKGEALFNFGNLRITGAETSDQIRNSNFEAREVLYKGNSTPISEVIGATKQTSSDGVTSGADLPGLRLKESDRLELQGIEKKLEAVSDKSPEQQTLFRLARTALSLEKIGQRSPLSLGKLGKHAEKFITIQAAKVNFTSVVNLRDRLIKVAKELNKNLNHVEALEVARKQAKLKDRVYGSVAAYTMAEMVTRFDNQPAGTVDTISRYNLTTPKEMRAIRDRAVDAIAGVFSNIGVVPEKGTERLREADFDHYRVNYQGHQTSITNVLRKVKYPVSTQATAPEKDLTLSDADRTKMQEIAKTAVKVLDAGDNDAQRSLFELATIALNLEEMFQVDGKSVVSGDKRYTLASVKNLQSNAVRIAKELELAANEMERLKAERRASPASCWTGMTDQFDSIVHGIAKICMSLQKDEEDKADKSDKDMPSFVETDLGDKTWNLLGSRDEQIKSEKANKEIDLDRVRELEEMPYGAGDVVNNYLVLLHGKDPELGKAKKKKSFRTRRWKWGSLSAQVSK